eukprot:2929617-Pleurochrysis_carterae.AAC.1
MAVADTMTVAPVVGQRYLLNRRAIYVWSATASQVGVVFDEYDALWASCPRSEFELAAKPLTA